jgi:hypothetical protein
VPYWEAGPQVAPWASGFFGGAAAAFPLLFVGSALGAALAPPSAGAETGGDDSGFDGGDDDFGGGDFDGGDFGGGGDYGGGGDFGGGGGDF